MFCVRSLAAALNRRVGWLAVAAVALAGCGGNSSRSTPYVPEKMAIFGDELSAVVAGTAPNDGLKYSINGINTTRTPNSTDCRLLPIWPQVVASYVGMVFPECNPDGAPATAQMLAAPTLKVADVVSRMEAYRTNPANAVSPKTLVTVMAGLNDVLQAMEDFKSQAATEADVRNRMVTLGNQLGDAINAMAAQGQGARVLFALLPRVSTSPYARDARFTDADRALLQELVDGNSNTNYVGFNGALRLRVTNNGRWAAMIVTEVYFSPYITRAINLTGLANNTDAACTTAPPNCTTATLVAGANGSATSYLWASDRWMSPIGHSVIGNEGVRQIRQGAF